MTVTLTGVQDPDTYAATFGLALQAEDAGRDRSQQTDGGILGGSDALSCHAKAVYTLRGVTPSNVPKKGKAQRGTYLHAGTLGAMEALYPWMLVEQELTVTLPSGLQVPLHPDVIDPSEPSVTDFKFVNDLALTRRLGPSDNQMAQRNLQYLAAHQAGLVPAEGMTRNLFVNADDLDERWVHQTPFDMEWVERADDFYRSAARTAIAGEEGRKDWPYNMCRDFCPFVDLCKPPLTDSDNQISNAQLRQTALTAFEAREARKNAERIEKEAVEHLKGVTGRAGNVRVVSTWINKGNGYWKVDLSEVAS